jgi:enoyl-CoA hydratase/carnithine racemase
MGTLVTYQIEDAVATITMDDGKLNVLSPQMFAELDGALDRAAADRAATVLTGRQGVFSAGFDLRVLAVGGPDAYRMVRTGFELAERILALPTPIVIACNGHALAMGAFLLLSGDYRVGAAGAHKIQANEVAIGITMPFFGVEICRQRLTPAHFNRAVINAESYPPDEAVAAGFLDRVVPAADLLAVARATAAELGKLNMEARAATKLRARAEALKALRAAIEADDAAFQARG